jgi:hypothetical protein
MCNSCELKPEVRHEAGELHERRFCGTENSQFWPLYMNTLVAEGVVLEPVFTPIADMVLTMAEVEGTVSMHSDGEPRTAVCHCRLYAREGAHLEMKNHAASVHDGSVIILTAPHPHPPLPPITYACA